MTNRPTDKPLSVTLRDVTEADLPTLFEHQRDPEANRMAAFPARDPEDREAFLAHWAKILADPALVQKAVIADGVLVGNVGCFPYEGRPNVCYWIARAHWGRGIATRALAELLVVVTERPLYAGVVKDNVASLRVLEKCGFRVIGMEKGFANARGEEVEEYILALDAP